MASAYSELRSVVSEDCTEPRLGLSWRAVRVCVSYS